MAFVQSDNKLYIQGGFGITDYITQLNLLDLSTSWPTSAPAWTLLRDGPTLSHHGLVLAKPPRAAGLGAGKQGYLISIGGASPTNATGPSNATRFWNDYDLQAGTWATFTSGTTPPFPGLEGHASVMDPNSGLVYIIGGYFSNTTYNALTVFDPSTKAIVSQQAANANTSLTDVAAVWSSVRSTILTFGGSRAPPATSNGIDLTNLQEYDPATKSWKTMTTSGTVPTRRLDHCVAASDDGSSIVLFGGSLDTKTYFYDIYILDVKTAKWRQGSPASSPRTRMACGLYANQFIAFGGSSADNRTSTMHTNVPIVYDVASDNWVDSFNAAESQQQPSNSPTTKKGNSNLGPIIGGAAAGAVILIGGAVALLLVIQRRKRESAEKVYENAKVVASLADDDDDRFYRRGPLAPRQQNYSTTHSATNSEIGGRNSPNISDIHSDRTRAGEYYALSDSSRGGKYNGGKTSSGYYDSITDVEEPGAESLRTISRSSRTNAHEHSQDDSRPGTAMRYAGASSPNPSLTQWTAQDQRLQRLQLQQQKAQYRPPVPPVTYPQPAAYMNGGRRPTSMDSDSDHQYQQSVALRQHMD
ncbi:hypothetical protein BGZ98_002559, partial [Dissophora globulifera]